MGDCFQKIGDLDATAEEAPALAKSVRHWLVADGVVSGDLTDCLSSGLGTRPGKTGRQLSMRLIEPTANGLPCGPMGYTSRWAP